MIADPASPARYCRGFREAAEKAGIGWAMWDWKTIFRYRNAKTRRPEHGMREALYGSRTSVSNP
jgi:hypothetical protein